MRSWKKNNNNKCLDLHCLSFLFYENSLNVTEKYSLQLKNFVLSLIKNHEDLKDNPMVKEMRNN